MSPSMGRIIGERGSRPSSCLFFSLMLDIRGLLGFQFSTNVSSKNVNWLGIFKSESM